jgi:hypothetical protein
LFSQIVAPNITSEKITFSISEVQSTGGSERLSRGDKVKFRIDVLNGKWIGVEVNHISSLQKSVVLDHCDLSAAGQSWQVAGSSPGPLGDGSLVCSGEEASVPSELFVACGAWDGPRAGYVFTSGKHGVGYYSAGVAHGPPPAPAAPEPPPADLATSVDPKEALGKISKALGQAKKSAKASVLLLRLANAQLDASTAPMFLDALCQGFVVSRDGSLCLMDSTNAPADAKEAHRDLFAALRAKLACFEDSPPPGADGVRTMSLGVGARGALTSDDTYVYCAAMREVREAVQSLTPLGERDEWAELKRKSILECLETAWEKKTWHWAKAEIETTFTMAAERRLCFSQGRETGDGNRDERERLDELTSLMRAQQRKVIVNRAVRATNSIAHPLRNKGFDAIR